MSNAGARRQLVHADNVFVEAGVLPDDEPVMLTAFVALQDIDERMGPTTWLLGTNNRAAHEKFYGDEKEHVLQSSTKVVGCLPKGACALFDPRTLHCGGANTSLERENTRALFYVSFKHPSIDYPGCPTCSGYGIVDSAFTLDELRTELSRQIERKEPSTRLAFASSFP
jgi:ectoine hydroxylase-related dioxygenase (phytanoyl-CoA dioxygenase family)